MRSWIRTSAIWLLRGLAAAALIVLMLIMSGVLGGEKIPPGRVAPPPPLPAPAHTATASLTVTPEIYEAVGTVRSRVEVTVAPQVTGRITDVLFEAGDAVEAGQLLATLESDEFEARLAQARSALESARALQEQATLGLNRIRRLFDKEAATQEQLEAAEALKKQADAGVEAARQKLEEAKVAMGYTRITSPSSGVVATREADPGDLAWPGRTLVTLQDPDDLRLEARVREGLISRVAVGDEVEILIPALDRQVTGTVVEITPSGDPVSRSFEVEARIPAGDRLYPGMFGKLRFRIGEREVVTVPARAVTSVGQLETVLLESEGRWVRRYVTTGRTRDERTEILSGVRPGEIVGWSETE